MVRRWTWMAVATSDKHLGYVPGRSDSQDCRTNHYPARSMRRSSFGAARLLWGSVFHGSRQTALAAELKAPSLGARIIADPD